MAEESEDTYKWVYDHTQLDSQGNPVRIGPVNDRLLNIVKWLPGAFEDSQIAELVSAFQDFLNSKLYTMPCKWDDSVIEVSPLKKIEQILELRNPTEMDERFIYLYSNLLGFAISNLEKLKESESTTTDTFNSVREILRAIPQILERKTTEGGLSTLFGGLGFYSNIKTGWAKNEQVYRTGEFEYVDKIDDLAEKDACPTPHFMIEINALATEISKERNQGINAMIDEIRPINTVLDGIQISTFEHSFSQIVDGGNSDDGMRLTIPPFWFNETIDIEDSPVFPPSE